MWGAIDYIRKARKIFKQIERKIFFFPLAWRRATTSVAYLSRHSPRRDNHNFPTYFIFFFFSSPSSESARKRSSIKANDAPVSRSGRREGGGRAKRESESLTRRNAQFSTPNRHRRWSSISSCRLEILGGKRAHTVFFQSLLPLNFSAQSASIRLP